MKISVVLFSFALTVFLLTGCSNPWITNTKRSAVEQFLLSYTIERGMSNAGLTKYAGRKVFMDYTYLDPQTDKAYVQGVLEMELARMTCTVVPKREEADIILQPLCGVLATDHNSFLIGTPPLPIPVPYTELTFAVPEIPLIKKTSRMAYGRFGFNVFDAKTRKPLETILGINSSARYNNWVVFFVPFKTHNMNMKDTTSVETVYEF